ncbi:A-kinase anchor protein 5 [Perognathus longimembris pacificus]|uniref:A-kinase anchor protein 5 n=1 Tax=Perognathus longimembris pacificus TaxID=214514 RepID=UPI002019DBE3|nr:A-kinase anchor protein 5 [Perognathus longimembris pacificus]
MKECSTKMETAVSEIQVENKDEKISAQVCPQDERQEEKASMLCFKRRKKTGKTTKAQKAKASSESAPAARKHPPETGSSSEPQRPRVGAWASIKRLVTGRKRSDSSKQQKSFEAEVQPEIKPEDAALSKKKAKSRLRIPCLRFSRGAQRNNHSKIIEDSDCNIKIQGEAEGLEIQTQTQSEDQGIKAKSTQELNEGVLQTHEAVCEVNENSSVMPEENVISVELGLDNRHSAVQAETVILEKEVEVTEEKQSIESQKESPLESSGADGQHPVVSVAPPPPVIPDQQIVEESSDTIQESGTNWKDSESREIIVEENKPKDTEMSQKLDLKENDIGAEKPKSEESKRMEPIAIIITDTEISEFDVKKSKNVPKQFLISVENEQVGVFDNDSDFEVRTSEQYEILLIETASSLVKNAIQLSIEQLVNEMISEDNKINTLLQ